jgi:hypothetical protein
LDNKKKKKTQKVARRELEMPCTTNKISCANGYHETPYLVVRWARGNDQNTKKSKYIQREGQDKSRNEVTKE